jgi:hypothetical protein
MYILIFIDIYLSFYIFIFSFFFRLKILVILTLLLSILIVYIPNIRGFIPYVIITIFILFSNSINGVSRNEWT